MLLMVSYNHLLKIIKKERFMIYSLSNFINTSINQFFCNLTQLFKNLNNNPMKQLLATVLLIISGFSCINNNPQELIDEDRMFSKFSKAHGMNKAFIEFAHDSAVILRDHSMPVVGIGQLSKLYSRPDTSFSLIWEPLYGAIARSGDLGYTYGTYTLKLTDSVAYGTYVTIWRKTPKGWKFVLDTGNDGL